MISIIKKTIKKFLENRKSGRLINVLKTDLFLVSYPKSGNTWLRFLLGNVLYEDYNFSNMEDLIPDIYVVNNKELNKIKSPRILKSHEYFDPRYKKIIYIVRDPRSVSISYFEYLKKMKSISKNMKFDNFLDLFLNGELDNYGSWSENVNSWVATKKEDKNFLIIKYENLKKDTLGSLSKIVNFLDLEYENEKLIDSVKKSSFESMKKDELRNQDKIRVLKKSNKEMPFVRKGEINEWKKYYSDKNLEKINLKFGNTMKLLGYEL